MSAVDEFVCEHRPALLKAVRKVQRHPSCKSLEGLVDATINAWLEKFGTVSPEPATSRERTFWYTLYAFEDVLEMHVHEPYRKVLMSNLVLAAKKLEHDAALPAGCFATRPGELESATDEEILQWPI